MFNHHLYVIAALLAADIDTKQKVYIVYIGAPEAARQIERPLVRRRPRCACVRIACTRVCPEHKPN